MKKSDHFDGQLFFNPDGRGPKDYRSLAKWLREKRTPWPKWLEDPAPEPLHNPIPAGEIRVTFVNHATILLRTNEWYLLTDPHFGKRASPLRFAGPKRVRRPAFQLTDFKKVDYVLISHNHYDHLDLDSVADIQERFAPRFFVPLANGPLLETVKVPKAKYQELDWWDVAQEPTGLKIALTPAQHWSSRGLFDRNKMLWGGFVIEWQGKKIYFAGDTGMGEHFEQIYKRFGAMDLALLPIGAYAPRWFMRDNHMDPHDAVKAHQLLQAKKSMGMHFGTFHLTNEGIGEPQQELVKARTAAGLSAQDFVVPNFGQTITV